MIFRVSQKLRAKVNAGPLEELLLAENPLVDWSCHLFVANRLQHILLVNTATLYSCLLLGKGITNTDTFIERALAAIRESLEQSGYEGHYERVIEPSAGQVQFAKPWSRSVIGSITELTKLATMWLVEIGEGLRETAEGLNDVPMSGAGNGKEYGWPKEAFREALEKVDCGN